MCFNDKVSLFTFSIGIIFSILLIQKGNEKYSLENKVSGIFFMFISLIQFMDFLFWSDIHNTFGINKITTIIGPILNVCQPTILYLIKYFYFQPDVLSFKHFNFPIAILNVLYFGYFISTYTNFLTNEKLLTTVKNGHLKWPWIKYQNPNYYLILFAINIFYLFNFNYAVTLFFITYLFLFLSTTFFKYNAGELWCFFGSFIPLIMFCISFYI